MSKETILTFFGPSCSEVAIKNSIEMAVRLNAHLSVVVLASAPPIHSYGLHYGGYADIAQWTDDVKDLSKALDERSKQIEALCQAENISAEVLKEYTERALMPEVVARHANVADRVVLITGNGLDAEIEDLVVSSVIFETPTSLVKGSTSHTAIVNPDNIFVAWDSSRHAAAAIHSALALLTAAKQVTIGIFDPVKRISADGEEPGADIASWLSRHGCNVTVDQYPSGGEEIGLCIAKRAAEKGTDLIVMGAYGHMKLKQQIFGGTTQSMLNQQEIPILIAHK